MKIHWKSSQNSLQNLIGNWKQVIGNSIGNSNGYLKFDRNNNEITNKNPAVNTFEISMTCQWKSIGKLVEIIMKDKLKFQ